MPKGIYKRTEEMMTGRYRRTPEMLTGKYIRTPEMQTGKYERTSDMLTGKHRKGEKMSEETRMKISKALLGIPKSNEMKRKLSLSRKSKSLKYIDMKKLTEMAKIANQKRKEIREENIKRGITPTVRPISDEHRKHLRESHLGYKPTEEAIRKSFRRNPMSSLEVKFNEIIRENNLPYKFVGNGEVLIGRKSPDFVNINGEKKAIEVYYRKHKELLRGNVEEWKTERIKIFNNYGWELLFFDETQVKEEYVLDVLKK